MISHFHYRWENWQGEQLSLFKETGKWAAFHLTPQASFIQVQGV
jgi:hypothetical protein